MAKKRISPGELARMFNALAQPAYVVDDDFRIVFCNRACAEWLGRGGDQLVGQPCVYQSPPQLDVPAAVAARLCPPPSVAMGAPTTGLVSYVAADGQTRLRQTRFVPLGNNPDELIGVVALVETDDRDDSGPAATLVDEPPSPDESTCKELHEQVRRFRRQAAGRFRADWLVGESPAMRRVRAQVELAAASHASVLLVGPPGSGRQHVAAGIHHTNDPASAGPMIPLACSVLGADLIRSTVMALIAKNPFGQKAARSTLLLNQADQIPLDVQAELVAMLAGRTFRLRLIATAERPLVERARDGAYRADLAALLSTITIELPSLAQRREDLPVLAQMFLEEANVPGGRQLGGFTPEALDELDAYAWPGNLDELAQVVAQACRRADGPYVIPSDLPEGFRLAAEAAARRPRTEETIVLDDFMATIEREVICRALVRAKGNKAKAARLLGLTRPRLYRRLIQLGLEREKGET